MTEEQHGGPQRFSFENLVDYVNDHIKTFTKTSGQSEKGDCQSQSLTLCRFLCASDEPMFVAELEGKHCVVYFDYKYWIDPSVGLIWNKSRTKYFKLNNFSQEYYEDYYGPNGLLEMNDDIWFLEIKSVARSLNVLEKLRPC